MPARPHRTYSLGRVEITDSDDMPLGVTNSPAEARWTWAVLDSKPSVVNEAAGQRMQ